MSAAPTPGNPMRKNLLSILTLLGASLAGSAAGHASWATRSPAAPQGGRVEVRALAIVPGMAR